MYRETTRAIQVTVEPSFVEDESAPDEGRYFWAYRIEISNLGEEVVRLRSRHWRITDANGQTEEVRGAGVVGKQPVLKPGETFAYTSGCPLSTPSGIMVGTLPDAERAGRAVLDRHSRLLARPARCGAGGELRTPADRGKKPRRRLRRAILARLRHRAGSPHRLGRAVVGLCARRRPACCAF